MTLPVRVTTAIRQLREQQQSPLCAYVYDLVALEQHVQQMRKTLPANCELFYAAKANPEAPILRTLAPLVDGFEAASGGELRWLHEQCPGQPLIFGGPGKLDSELEMAMDYQISAFHVESLNELRSLARIAARRGRKAPVLLRLNLTLVEAPESRLVMGGKPTPFGLDEAALQEALVLLRNEPWLELRGLHFHLLSHQLDVNAHLRLIRSYFKTFRQLCTDQRFSLPLINVGGGMGINYQDPQRSFDWPLFCKGLDTLIVEENMDTTQIRFEIGRFISAACGYYLMQVLDIKRNHGHYFAIGRGGTHHFRTPAAQGHDHPVVILRGPQPPQVINESVTLVGQLCTPKDVLAKQQPVAELAVDDLLVFPLAGAYAWNISHRDFLMHEPPRMLFLKK
ncbi:type III PLP-dependent enzyme [Pseudomonas sp. CCI3.2]|uniref:type III PLP-dependent enzyme n=1 Tax=unclassified Pseudomonas TaxID=196821 RepID=UPI002AC9A807|nr:MULTISPECIES: type III PLP-dependent enzyme [unclassified Pseudomonas]MEB0076408.1 type III PLP-dependent enzyme [Pseudomonas sp. MH10out]MEB0091243.1 type III PLP-dependent enzyme [Pseudomonas sp. CCI4.2]MEB0100803.1 type III PLP-dependent enzyme [Pseudomonas sp. CCI3.2]MEB0128812.1 type III PLP-dependent enzyme [Pseudomonas sp. CCI2.4]MEB0156961.1 type III PLP-dependent enzyme [Pseudomonas sp. AH2 (2023)]